MTVKEIPHNIEAEDNVIGSLLLDGNIFSQLNLIPTDFFDEKNQFVYAAFKSLASKNVSINQITTAQELDEQKKLKQSGGAARLAELVAQCATPFDCQYFADIVKRLSTYRQMIVVSGKISDIGYERDSDVAKSLKQADDLLLSLRKNTVSPAVVSPKERTDMMFSRYDKLFNEQPVSLSTGLKELDVMLGGGLFNGEMIILGARPGMGKTNLMMNIANSVGSSGKNVLFCSAEMPLDAVTDRDVASIIGQSTNTVRRGAYSQEIYDQIVDSLGVIAERNVYIVHESPLTSAKILQHGLNMQLRSRLDLIVVDYLALLDDEFGSSQYERVGHISRKLKQVAMEINVPILVAAQLNRGVEGRDDKHPHLQDLRDSGKIEEDADVVMFLYRESYYTEVTDNTTEIIIAKQRQGEANKIVRVAFDREHQTYRDLYHGDAI